MTRGLKLLTRVALFSALVYVFTWLTASLPNISLTLFIIFMAGFVWGSVAGSLVGIIGMGLSSAFNPYGPAHLYVMLAQMIGAALSGVVGGAFASGGWRQTGRKKLTLSLALIGGGCTILYFLPVNVIDAWLIGPFWARLTGGSLWSLVSVGSNVLIFPLLFGVARHLYVRENGTQ